MGEGLEGRSGGITGLVRVIRDHGEALEADLIERGLRLRNVGTEEFTWADLSAIVRHLPDSSALVRDSMDDLQREKAQWGVAEQLMAVMANALNVLVWAKTEDASKGINKPEPILPPGVTPPNSGAGEIHEVLEQLNNPLLDEYMAGWEDTPADH